MAAKRERRAEKEEGRLARLLVINVVKQRQKGSDLPCISSTLLRPSLPLSVRVARSAGKATSLPGSLAARSLSKSPEIDVSLLLLLHP